MNEQAMEDIREITGPEAFPVAPPDWTPWLVALAVVAALLLLALGAWAVVRLARRARPLRHRERALRALECLRSGAETDSPNRFATGVLRVVKEYLHHRYGDPLLYETPEEFAERAAAGPGEDPGRRDRLARLLERCGNLQFAGIAGSPDERRALVEEAMAILKEEPPDGSIPA